MLDLQWTLAGSPSGGFQHLALKHTTLVLYPCAHSVVILNAATLALVRVLSFWEIFPSLSHTKEHVNCLSVDSGMNLILASMGTRIAAWTLSGVQNDTWRVHSSLLLPDNHTVTTLDCKSGLLAVGSRAGLSVYTLRLENSLPTWTQKWTTEVVSPSLARFAPSLMFIATITPTDSIVRIYSTMLGRQTQAIPHPRPVTSICWRHSQASSRDDLILYTITSDTTLRIFLPVLDSPQHLQLHASLDIFSALPFSVASMLPTLTSRVFWLDREVVGNSLNAVLEHCQGSEDGPSKRLREIRDEGWDLFLRVLGDKSVTVSAVANIDRRPPTLLRQFVLHQSLPSALPSLPDHFYLLPNIQNTTITVVATPPLVSYELEPLAFFDAQPVGLRALARRDEHVTKEESEVIRFVRTPEGKGVGVVRDEGGEAWTVVDHGRRCRRTMQWSSVDLVVVLAKGKYVATYTTSDNTLTLRTTPTSTLILPGIIALFSLPSKGQEAIFGITPDHTIFHILVQMAPVPRLLLCSQTRLPLPSPPRTILPVDPMAWSGAGGGTEHDVLVGVSTEGELGFWVPEEGTSAHWRCTGKVRTGRSGFTKVMCSSAKKSALVVPGDNGEELSIWDSLESEFSSGLEYRTVYSPSEPIRDLDWTATPDGQSILAIGFAHQVELLSQQRKTYFDDGPNWAVIWKVQIGSFIPFAISDSIWLAHGSLLVGAGHQLFLFGQDTSDPSSESLFEHVVRFNGPLPDYHPQMLLQCLLWEKVELVKEIIVRLAQALQNGQNDGLRTWEPIPVEQFFQKDATSQQTSSRRKKGYTFLFDTRDQNEEAEDEFFSRPLIDNLIESLEAKPIPHLTPNENAHLLVLIQTTLEIDEQRRALDANGLRYLISMRSFYILNQRTSAPSSRASNGAIPRQIGRRQRLRYRDMIWAFFSESQDILLYACASACNGKMCWSDARALGTSIWLSSVDSLKTHIESIARNEYMSGDNRDPTTCTLFYFAIGKVKLVQGLWRQAAWHKEQASTLKFLSNDFSDARWRTAALKNAFALLGKQRYEYAAAFFLLGGSLKDAVNVCIKQLSDFQLAVAIARVVEQSDDGPIFMDILNNTVLPIAFSDGNRWLATWAFWLLHRRDLAVRVLLTPLQDISKVLNVRIQEIGHSEYDDPSLALLFSQLRSKTLQAAQGTSEISGRAEFNFVLQIARVFCRMGCHVLALDLVRSWSFVRPSTVVRDESRKPDVSLSLPSVPPSPILRRSMFPLEPAMRRRSSIMIDVDIPSEPPTRKGSPEPSLERPTVPVPIIKDTIQEETDLFARKAGIGHLMKSAKQDVKVAEFDMSAFF